MDMGISGKKALVCASSKGLGRGCAEALAGEGVHLVINGRNGDVLAATASEIRSNCGVSGHRGGLRCHHARGAGDVAERSRGCRYFGDQRRRAAARAMVRLGSR